MNLYLDMDGVLADFNAGFELLFGMRTETFRQMHGEQADDVMWPTINAHPDFFRDLPPCQGALEFFKGVRHLAPAILTACPKVNYPHVASLKREWVQQHLGHDITVLPVMGGRNKPLFMHSKGDILIDDHIKNINAWNAAGGIGILHNGVWARTMGALEQAA